MEKRRLGPHGPYVSALGLGCMGMSEFYGPADRAESIKTIKEAFHQGITFFDTADMYGTGDNEILVGEAIKEFRHQIVLATKFGIVRKSDDPFFRAINCKPEYVKEACEASLKRLNVDVIDLYYMHRFDEHTPIEDTVYAMAKLVAQGKVKAIGLSEVNAETIRRAHAVYPITAIQTEYSLWSRGVEKEILPLCKQLGIGFVPYSPVGRGFLTGKIKSEKDFPKGDFRQSLPRFQGSNFAYNLKIVEVVESLAKKKGCKPSQIALSWALSQSPYIVPIFGTTKVAHLIENCESLYVHLEPEEIALLNGAVPPGFARGARYGDTSMKIYHLEE